MKYSVLIVSSCLSFFLLFSCSSSSSSTDTNRKGKVSMAIEESFKPLFDTSIYTFEGLYPSATVTPIYTNEGKILEEFFAKKWQTICISRDLTDKEKASLKSMQIEVRSDKVAEDAIALIVNPENMDTLITVDKLKRILTGKDTTWNGLKTKINVVFDQENSANFRYLKELCGIEKLPLNVFAVNSNEDVINYVKKNKSALGVIGLNWISDQDDQDVLNFVNGLKVMSVAKKEKDDYFKPYAGFIFTKEYPLSREIWLINYAKKSGLLTSFVNFMITEKGQLIVQKSALVPATAQVRLIQMNTDQ